jgi:hypothetical protein
MVNNMDVNALRRLNEKVKESYVYDDDGDDDDEDKELEMDSTTMETDKKDRRDEVGEVRKMSSKDTNRLRLWRVIVTGVLLLTAFAVTFTTYTLLERQEDDNFKTAVRSVSSRSFLDSLRGFNCDDCVCIHRFTHGSLFFVSIHDSYRMLNTGAVRAICTHCR